MGFRKEPVNLGLLPVAGKPTFAKVDGISKIFFEEDPAVFVAAPKPKDGHSLGTPHLLSWLPPVPGATLNGYEPGERHGRRHLPAPGGSFGGGERSILAHLEYPPQPPRPSRVRIGGGDEYSRTRRRRAHGGKTVALLSSGEVGAFAQQPHRSPGAKVTARDAAMLLPPIHGRPQLPPEHPEPPSWGVTVSRKPFRT